MGTEIVEQKSMSNGERWLSVEEISAHLGISKETVYRWLEKQRIPAHRVGKLWKFKISDVDKWVTKGGATEYDSSKSKAKRRNT